MIVGIRKSKAIGVTFVFSVLAAGYCYILYTFASDIVSIKGGFACLMLFVLLAFLSTAIIANIKLIFSKKPSLELTPNALVTYITKDTYRIYYEDIDECYLQHSKGSTVLKIICKKDAKYKFKHIWIVALFKKRTAKPTLIVELDFVDVNHEHLLSNIERRVKSLRNNA